MSLLEDMNRVRVGMSNNSRSQRKDPVNFCSLLAALVRPGSHSHSYAPPHLASAFRWVDPTAVTAEHGGNAANRGHGLGSLGILGGEDVKAGDYLLSAGLRPSSSNIANTFLDLCVWAS
jgi:hypothetical protein